MELEGFHPLVDRLPAETGCGLFRSKHLARRGALLDEGICFLNRRATPRFTIEFFNFATRQTTRVTTVEKDADIPGPRGFAVSPDRRWVLYKRVDQIENDLILVENFR